jgi:hypothetical protein
MVYLIYCENLCKCYNVPPPGTTIKEKINIWKKKLDLGEEGEYFFSAA